MRCAGWLGVHGHCHIFNPAAALRGAEPEVDSMSVTCVAGMPVLREVVAAAMCREWQHVAGRDWGVAGVCGLCSGQSCVLCCVIMLGVVLMAVVAQQRSGASTPAHVCNRVS